jgi:hypothetical protein
MPTLVHSDQDATAITRQVNLTCSKHQEVFTCLRPDYDSFGADGKPENRLAHPNANHLTRGNLPFYRPELSMASLRLLELRPGLLYIFGGKSDVSTERSIRAKMEMSGLGAGGSVGAKEGRVKQIAFDDIKHLITMEASEQTAN